MGFPTTVNAPAFEVPPSAFTVIVMLPPALIDGVVTVMAVSPLVAVWVFEIIVNCFVAKKTAVAVVKLCP